MSVSNESLDSEVKTFMKTHTTLCVCTLGLAIPIYALGKLGGRLIHWLREHYGSAKKADNVRESVLPKGVSTQQTEKKPKIYAARVALSDQSLPSSHYDTFEKLGFSMQPVDPSLPIATADELPEGWTLKKSKGNQGQEIRTFYDNHGHPQVELRIVRNSFTNVQIFSEQESEARYQTDLEMQEGFAQMKERVLQDRSETWSESKPWTVYFKKDLSQYEKAQNTKKKIITTYHGYFSSEEIAKEAVKLLPFVSHKDEVEARKVGLAVAETIRDWDMLKNGFENPEWFNAFF